MLGRGTGSLYPSPFGAPPGPVRSCRSPLPTRSRGAPGCASGRVYRHVGGQGGSGASGGSGPGRRARGADAPRRGPAPGVEAPGRRAHGARTAQGLARCPHGGRSHGSRTGERGARQRCALPTHGPGHGGPVSPTGEALPEEAFAAALASVPQMGPATLRALLTTETPSAAWSRGSFEGDVARIWQRREEKGIEVCWRGGPVYPRRLMDDPEAPAVLFCQGDPMAINRHPTVAIVGTRSPTRYGIGVAAQFGADLAAVGVSIVSGLALGIDGAAHEGATAAGAPPIAVVAGGLDDPYPRRHARLWARVAEQGAVYSESPAGVRTEKWRFPVRNRLLAMFSDVVVVVESRHRGGSM